MEITQDILFSGWDDLKVQVRQQWSKLSDDSLTRLNGKTEELVGVLQQLYGYDKTQAEAEINYWLRVNDQNNK